MTTKDNEGNGFTRAKCKQQQKKNKELTKHAGRQSVHWSLATLLYSHLRLYSSRNLAIASGPIIRSLAALLMGGVGGEGEPGTWSIEEIGDRYRIVTIILPLGFGVGWVGALGVGWGGEGEDGIWSIEEIGRRYKIITVIFPLGFGVGWVGGLGVGRGGGRGRLNLKYWRNRGPI